MTRPPIRLVVLAAIIVSAVLDPTDGPRVQEGRAPTPWELVPSVEAAFQRESYVPGTTATLALSNRAEGIRI